jgi:hypothetical protein
MMQYFELYKDLLELEDEMTDSELVERIHTCEKAICNTLDRLDVLEHRFNQHEAKELKGELNG